MVATAWRFAPSAQTCQVATMSARTGEEEGSSSLRDKASVPRKPLSSTLMQAFGCG